MNKFKGNINGVEYTDPIKYTNDLVTKIQSGEEIKYASSEITVVDDKPGDQAPATTKAALATPFFSCCNKGAEYIDRLMDMSKSEFKTLLEDSRNTNKKNMASIDKETADYVKGIVKRALNQINHNKTEAEKRATETECALADLKEKLEMYEKLLWMFGELLAFYKDLKVNLSDETPQSAPRTNDSDEDSLLSELKKCEDEDDIWDVISKII